MAFLHSAQLLYTDCGYPRWSVFFTLPNAIFFYMLFNNFYKKSYVPPTKTRDSIGKSQKEALLNNNNDNTDNNNIDKNNNNNDKVCKKEN